ncbi:MAG: hypothetical protein J6S63_02160 [Atopobiaceae bacterium]|nr:hypothetical protein [Atopobiaceae bacterium]
METTTSQRPTPLFRRYVVQLLIRLAFFVLAVVLLVLDPRQLDITSRFGIDQGLSFVNVAFVFLALDLVSKLRPHARIAMGSLKQYAQNHVPTPRMFVGGVRELRERAMLLIRQMPEQLRQMVVDTRQAAQETAQGVVEAGKQFAYSIDVLRVLPWPQEDLTANERLRDSIRKNRIHEIVPVVVFWVVFNVAVGLLLDRMGWLNPQTALVWAIFYSLFDMISVVLWCPLQLALMRNRCCTTCQIFNWDGIMTVTPLFTCWCWFSGPLLLLALVVLVRWELAFARHPERFDERTNASLQCANCKDKLCHLRKPLTPRQRA